MLIIALLISLFLLLGTSLMGQNPPIALPADGDWPTVVGDSIMLIGPKQEALTEEQRYFNPPYLLVYPGKEHLKNDMIRAAICDCNPANPNRRIGVFSVAPDKQVSFSQGNLQYLPAANIWKFADTQYEYLGNANKYLKPTFRNWVDLFGWSTNNTTAPFGVSTSTNVADYAGDFVDWGENEICGDAPNTWRTLSADEWEFLFEKRSNALQLRSKGSIEGHRGHILLPDNWVLPDGVQFVAEPNNLTMDLDINSYTQAEWRIMEKAGAIFLPAAGRRDGTTVGYLVEYSGVWSSTSTTNTNAYHSYYNYESEVIEHHWTSATSRMNGRSVRLVHDTVPVSPEPEYVDLGLSVKWATFNVGAISPEDYGDYFAWGETEPKETYSWATYKWGTSSNLTKYNATDGKTILEPADDAAHVHWGGKWRMPTKEEQKELIDSCTWEWTTSNNINGYRVTGPNGHSIFLPAGGVRINDVSYAIDEFGYYWSSSHMIDSISEAHSIVFTPTSKSCDSDWLYRGRKIRPVYDDRPSKRIGVFSVSADKQVSFSQGNLQYTQSTDEWQFAREQYEYIGAANIKDSALADRIDMFGWSANNTTAPFGVSTSTNVADYAGAFVDWGVNTISGDAPGTWRTLSIEEWKYLFENRANAAQLYGVAQVVGENGMIILPDDWVVPDGITFKHGFHQNDLSFAQHQTFTEQQWLLMETAGAIFLPAAGIVYNSIITAPKAGGHYQSSDTDSINTNYWFGFRSSYYTIQSSERCTRRAVRLVHDTIVPKAEPEYVDLGLSVKWATFNVGATSPEDYGDYFAWGETEPKENYNWATYKWCDGDYTKLNKYCTKEQYGMVDNQTILQLCDDAAHTKLGGNWRMPTMEECQELVNLCTWTWTTINGINGHVITGPNGNTIFLPATGAITTSGLAHARQSGYYWINSISTTNPYNANDIYNRPPDTEMEGALPTYGINAFSRYIGRPIRPVYDDPPKYKIIWYTDEAIKGEGDKVSITNKAGFAYLHPEGKQSTELNRCYQGKRINCIRLQVAKEGSFTVSVADRDGLDSLFNQQTIMLKNPSKEPQVYHLPQTIHLQKNQVLVFAQPTDDGKFYYTDYIGDITFYAQIGQKEVDISNARKTLHIDAGYYCEDGENCDTTAIPEPEYVDLGLSVKWATFNVGATSPEDYGDYFAWGETEPKEEYTWENYKWCNATANDVYIQGGYREITTDKLTKYNDVDGLITLLPEDDAATANWGNKWRMPTRKECQELIDNCTWEKTTLNGVSGYRVKGSNNNSIFLPDAGYKYYESFSKNCGSYWPANGKGRMAHTLHWLASNWLGIVDGRKYCGVPIRPVYDDSN